MTDISYTGQRELGPSTGPGQRMGLMDYHARFYSPYLNHFTQPDTLIPSAENPQAWNRYSYVLNSPILYNDPSGHMETCEDGDICGHDYEYDDGKDKNKDEHDEIFRIVEFAAGAFLIVGGLLVTTLGAFLIVSGLIETSTIIGAALGLHQIPIGVAMGLFGLGITAAGGYLIYDSLSAPSTSSSSDLLP
jgi:RHS repeat-associated protein